MPNPLSGSFLPFKAGSPSGSTPKCQSAQVSLTETIILEQDKRNVEYHSFKVILNIERCLKFH